MRKQIIAFGASNSSRSINKIFADYAASQLEKMDYELLDLNDYEMPIYSIDREEKNGIPDLAIAFKEKVKNADGIIISFAEHNGAYTVAFKNIMDWLSRMDGSTWDNKPLLLLSTSPGGRGAKTVLGIAENTLSRMNKAPLRLFSLPSFKMNFEADKGILDKELRHQFEQVLREFQDLLNL